MNETREKHLLFLKIFLIFIISSLILFSFQLSLADTQKPIINGLKNTGGEIGYPIKESGEPEKKIVPLLGTIANGLLGLMGLLFFLLILYGGYIWLIAAGNEEKITKAKKIIMHSAIALLVLLTARILAEFVIKAMGRVAGL